MKHVFGGLGPIPGGCDFLASFAALNGLAPVTATAWVVRSGMEFGAGQAWWRPGTVRPVPHAGLDFVSYRDSQGQDHPLPVGAAIPALYPGQVAAVFQDFLGATVLLCHPLQDLRGWSFCTIYGHLVPVPGLECGAKLAAGARVGGVAGPAAGRGQVTPHLHLSLGWLATEAIGADFDWTTLGRSARVDLLDPEPFLGQRQLVMAGPLAEAESKV